MPATADVVNIESETDLLDRARSGEAEAYCLLTRPHQTRLFSQALTLSADTTDAEDLVQETLLAGWQSLSRFSGRCRLSTWLYAILVHRHQKLLRRRRSWLRRFVPFLAFPRSDGATTEVDVPAKEPGPWEILAASDDARQLMRQVHRLPLKQRQVILLRFYDDASVSEIATALGCSEGTVKSRLHYALSRLRKDLLNERDPSRDE